MLFVEPERTPYDLEFRFFGIPVRVHPLFWLVAVVMGGMGGFDPLLVLLWTIAVFVSILWHELGHAFVVRFYGERPWITLYAMGGLASYHTAGFSRRADPTVRTLAITLAGPGNQLLLAAAISGVLFAFGYGISIENYLPQVDPRLSFQNEIVYVFVQYMIYVNIFWALLNLLPIWPLDGGRVMETVATRVHPGDGLRMTLVTSILTCIVIGVFFFLQFKMIITAVFFAYIAFQNYQVLQSISYRRW